MKNYLWLISIITIIGTTTLSAATHSKKGEYFINTSPLTAKYDYEFKDLQKVLPDSYGGLLNNNIYGQKSDSDLLNESLGFGYYVTNKLSIEVIYTDGLEVDPFLNGLFASNILTANMTNFDFDAKYDLFQFSDSLAFFVQAGVTYHHIRTRVTTFNNKIETVLAKTNINKYNSKFGVGLKWYFANNWGATVGYSQNPFMSLKKTYLELEFRW